MKIFPIRPLSTFDNIKNIYKIIEQTSKNSKAQQSDFAAFDTTKTLRKGRSVCDMLSE